MWEGGGGERGGYQSLKKKKIKKRTMYTIEIHMEMFIRQLRYSNGNAGCAGRGKRKVGINNR